MKKESLSESEIQKRHLEKLAYYPHVKMWRNNVGLFRVGGRMIRTGLCPGSADLIGFESIIITPEMVGKKIAIFRADEVKRPNKKPDPHQEEWLALCQKMGAIVNVITD